MPEVVLALFQSTGVVNRTARELVRVARKIGVEELERRAKEVDPKGRSWTEIVAILEGKEPSAPRYVTSSVTGPLERASHYHQGLAAKAWLTVSEAAEITGWDRADLSKAVAVSKLPATALDLFDGKRFTKELGETLLAIQRWVGLEKMVQNAKTLHEFPKRRTRDELVTALAGAKSDPDFTLRMRRKACRVTFELTCDVRDAARLLVDLDQLKSMLQSTLKNSPRKRI
jgi:hypothetical protein